jgi:hypothetical protein
MENDEASSGIAHLLQAHRAVDKKNPEGKNISSNTESVVSHFPSGLNARVLILYRANRGGIFFYAQHDPYRAGIVRDPAR